MYVREARSLESKSGGGGLGVYNVSKGGLEFTMYVRGARSLQCKSGWLGVYNVSKGARSLQCE